MRNVAIDFKSTDEYRNTPMTLSDGSTITFGQFDDFCARWDHMEREVYDRTHPIFLGWDSVRFTTHDHQGDPDLLYRGRRFNYYDVHDHFAYLAGSLLEEDYDGDIPCGVLEETIDVLMLTTLTAELDVMISCGYFPDGVTDWREDKRPYSGRVY